MCRSPECYAIADDKDRKSPVDRHNAHVDRHDAQNSPLSSESSNSSEERVYKPKLPFPRRKSKQELEDAQCKAILEKLVVEFPLIGAEKLSPVVIKCLQRMAIKNLSSEQFSAILSVEVCSLIEDMTPEEPTKPPMRELTKLATPGRFVVPCVVNGIELTDSLCDTGANANVMSMAVAKRLGISDFEPTKASLKFANASSTSSKGFIRDLKLQVGDCLVPTDFYVLERKEDNDDPLILGQAFLATVGALVDFTNERISFSRINKDVYYPAVHVKEISCLTVTTGEKPLQEKKTIPCAQISTPIPSTAHHGDTKPVKPKCKKVPPSIPPPLRSDGGPKPAKAKSKTTSKPFSKFRIIIPMELREKGVEVIQEMLQNTTKLFPGVSPCTIPRKT